MSASSVSSITCHAWFRCTSRVVAAFMTCAFAHGAVAQVARSCSPPGAPQLIVLPDEATITQARLLDSPVRPGADVAFYLSLGAPTAAAALNFDPYHYVLLTYSTLVDLDPILWSLQAMPGIRNAGTNSYVCPATPPAYFSSPVEVYELRSKRWGTYYYLLTDFEYRLLKKATATTDADWEWTDETFFAEPNGSGYCNGYLPVHRLEYRGADGYFNHYYTQDLQVCGQAKSEQGLVSRGAPFWAAPARTQAGGSPCPGFGVYRLYNNREGEARPNHRYTTNPVLAGQLVAQGWTNEGIAFCASR